MGNRSSTVVDPLCYGLVNIQVVNNTENTMHVVVGGIDTAFMVSGWVAMCGAVSCHHDAQRYRLWRDSVEIGPGQTKFFAEANALSILSNDGSGPSDRLLWSNFQQTQMGSLKNHINKILANNGLNNVQVGDLRFFDDLIDYLDLPRRTAVIEFVTTK